MVATEPFSSAAPDLLERSLEVEYLTRDFDTGEHALKPENVRLPADVEMKTSGQTRSKL
jgi:hypothetical protein